VLGPDGAGVTGGAGSDAGTDEGDEGDGAVVGGVGRAVVGGVVLLDGDVAGLKGGFTTTLGDGVRRSPAP
jgi:hypothetical protein